MNKTLVFSFSFVYLAFLALKSEQEFFLPGLVLVLSLFVLARGWRNIKIYLALIIPLFCFICTLVVFFLIGSIMKYRTESFLGFYLKDFKNSVTISALKGINIEQLLERLSLHLEDLMSDFEVFIPQEKMQLLNLIYEEGQVFKKEYRQGKIYLQGRIPRRVKAKLENILQKESPENI